MDDIMKSVEVVIGQTWVLYNTYGYIHVAIKMTTLKITWCDGHYRSRENT